MNIKQERIIMIIKDCKSFVRPFWRLLYSGYERLKNQTLSLDVAIDKILCGGSNGIRAAKYAEITNNFLLPSRLAIDSPHFKLLEQYDEIGEEIFKEGVFEKTEYYKKASQCIDLTGSAFYDEKSRIIDLARSFIDQYNGISFKNSMHPGQSSLGAPIWLRPIKNSSYYELVDGHHRVALAYKAGQKKIRAIKYYDEAVFTPLQQLLLDVLWINKNKWLYQPISSPEISEQWILVRNCEDRLTFMKNFLKDKSIQCDNTTTYLDVGSSYGWFVNEFSKLGLDSFGIERDCIAIEVGERAYGLSSSRIVNSEIGHYLKETDSNYDVVSCMSVMHHFILNKNSTSAVELIQNLDRITKRVLFLDTAQSHEREFAELLPEWNDDYIINWIKENTTFKKVIPLGVDNDQKPPFEGYYNRTFFACIR